MADLSLGARFKSRPRVLRAREAALTLFATPSLLQPVTMLLMYRGHAQSPRPGGRHGPRLPRRLRRQSPRVTTRRRRYSLTLCIPRMKRKPVRSRPPPSIPLLDLIIVA